MELRNERQTVVEVILKEMLLEISVDLVLFFNLCDAFGAFFVAAPVQGAVLDFWRLLLRLERLVVRKD